VCCPEEIASGKASSTGAVAAPRDGLKRTGYGEYLQSVLNERVF